LGNSSVEITPKALANCSPGLERSDNPGIIISNLAFNPEMVRPAINPFWVMFVLLCSIPGLSLRPNPGLQIANAFGVIANSHRRWLNVLTFSSFQESLP
jgi:hypothetical protein